MCGGFALRGVDRRPRVCVFFQVRAALVRDGAGRDVWDHVDAVQRSSLPFFFAPRRLKNTKGRALDRSKLDGGGWGGFQSRMRVGEGEGHHPTFFIQLFSKNKKKVSH